MRCGGGDNHRIGLFDAVLIKENHIAAVGSVSAAVAGRAATVAEQVMIEVEVETLAQLREALATDADRIMLDDFSLDDMRAAVALRDAHRGKRQELEASGSVDAATLNGRRRHRRRLRLDRRHHEARPRDRLLDALRLR